MKTKLAEGRRIQYNFVKPHMALEGQTPADSAGIRIEGENNRMELIIRAIREKKT
jgi:hypothetical protein